MVISQRLLNEGEHVVVSTRTHVKALLLPALALVVVLRLVVAPFLRWMTTSYTVTDRRLITRTGVLSRRGHDIPLARINDVAYEHGLVDRMLGCGTLVVSDASEHGRVRLHDIPHVEQVHLAISDLLFGHTDDPREHRLDDGT